MKAWFHAVCRTFKRLGCGDSPASPEVRQQSRDRATLLIVFLHISFFARGPAFNHQYEGGKPGLFGGFWKDAVDLIIVVVLFYAFLLPVRWTHARFMVNAIGAIEW
jgi:hypothetical protein